MATTTFINAQGTGIVGNTTTFNFLIQSSNFNNTTEATRQAVVTTAATFSQLRVRASTNTLAVDCVLTVRKNGTDTGMILTIPAGTTGEFQNDIDSVSFTAGDLVSLKMVTAVSSGSAALTMISGAWTTLGNDGVQFIGAGRATSTPLSTTQYYSPLTGRSAWTTTTANAAPVSMLVQTTARNLAVNVSSNTRTSNTTIAPIINGTVSTTQTITIPAGTTGAIINSTDQTVLAPGDTLRWGLYQDTGSGTVVVAMTQCELVTSDGSWLTHSASTGINTVTHGNTNWLPAGGDLIVSSLITNYPGQLATVCVAKHIHAYLNSNTSIIDSTLTLLKNGTATALTLTIPAGQIGYVESSEASVVFAPGDTAQLEMTVPTGSGSNSFKNAGVRFAPIQYVDLAGVIECATNFLGEATVLKILTGAIEAISLIAGRLKSNAKAIKKHMPSLPQQFRNED